MSTSIFNFDNIFVILYNLIRIDKYEHKYLWNDFYEM